MLSRSTLKTTLTAKPGSSETKEASYSEEDVADLLSMSTIRSSGAGAGMTPRITLSPSVGSITKSDMEYTGTEPLDFVLSLSKKEQQKWVLIRLAAFKDAMVMYATVAQQAKDRGKSVSEAEWEAILATDGLTRAVPQEQHIFAWIMGVK